MVRMLLPVLFVPALMASPVLELQPRPAAPALLAAPRPGVSFVSPDRDFTISEASVIRGLIRRRGGLFDPAPAPRHWSEPLPFALTGCGFVALGFVLRRHARPE